MTHSPIPITEDGFRRRVSYLRISLTDRCNLACRYCMPQGGIKYFPKDDLLTLDELKRILRVFRNLGVRKVRLTGGEPLLRSDLEEIIKEVQALGIREVSLTTNGLLLVRRALSLKNAGLRNVNISLDTFKRDRFMEITGSDGLDLVLEGIRLTLDLGFRPVKINFVVMREHNLEEIRDFALYAKDHPVEVRFLELMPTANNFEGKALVSQESFVPASEIMEEVRKTVSLGEEEQKVGVAKVYPVTGGLGKIGFVSPVSNHFCSSCDRIRLTARGRLKTCLHGPETTDLKSAILSGAEDRELEQMVRNALLLKPEEHFIRPDHYVSRYLQMSQVGG